jgi:hypothetical protein
VNSIWKFLLDDKKGSHFSKWAMLIFGSVILVHQVWLKFFEERKYTHAPTGYNAFVDQQILQHGEGDLIQGEFLVGSGRKIEADDTPEEPSARETTDPDDPDLVDSGESNEGLLEAQDLVDLRLNEALLGRANPMIQAFVEHSYLRGDLAFPANFRYKFAEGGNKLAILGLRDNVHRRYLPFSESLRYQGDILFRQDTPQVVLRDNTKSRYTLKAGEGAKIIDMMPGNPRSDFSAQEIDLRLGGEQIAVLKPVGDELILRVARNAGGLCDVRLNGQKLPPDTVRRVEPSDILYMEFPIKKNTKADYYLVVEEVREGVISTIRLTDQGRTRIPEQELVPGLSHGLEGALDSIVLQLAAKAPDSAKFLQDLNLRLSLVEPLQRAVQETLVTYARKIDGIDGKTAKEPFRKLGEFRAPPLRAAVTVMDIVTGEVLALGSYPDEKTLDDLLAGLDKKASDAAAKPGGELLQRAILLRRSEIERLRGTLLSNQNFPLHQIGSIFKPIFSLSVFATYPDLVTLKIPGHAENENKPVLGYDMGKFSDHNHGTTDSSSFIAYSCQRYMEYLGVFSLGRKENGVWAGLKEGGNEITIDGKGYSGVLQPKCEKNQCLLWQKDSETLVAKQYTEVRNLEKAPVSLDLEKRYGIALTRWNTESLPEEELYDITPWSSVISTIKEQLPEEEAGGVSSYFTGLSPVKVVSYLEDFRALYRDFTQYLKGSGLNVWSNITVAQSIARLITERQVNAWMGRLEDPLTPPKPETCAGGAKPIGTFQRCPAKALPSVPEEALAAVLKGMEDVSEEGTATRLKPDVDKAIKSLTKDYPGEKFTYYSKTGSVRRPWSMRLLLVDKQKERQSKVCPGKGGPSCPSWLRDPEKDSLPGANYVFALVGGPEGGSTTRGVVVMVYIADAGGSQTATQYVKEAKLLELLAIYLRGEANGQ